MKSSRIKELQTIIHGMLRLQEQRRRLTHKIINYVEVGNFAEAQRLTKLYEIINRKCKVYAELKHAYV